MQKSFYAHIQRKQFVNYTKKAIVVLPQSLLYLFGATTVILSAKFSPDPRPLYNSAPANAFAKTVHRYAVAVIFSTTTRTSETEIL